MRRLIDEVPLSQIKNEKIEEIAIRQARDYQSYIIKSKHNKFRNVIISGGNILNFLGIFIWKK